MFGEYEQRTLGLSRSQVAAGLYEHMMCAAKFQTVYAAAVTVGQATTPNYKRSSFTIDL